MRLGWIGLILGGCFALMIGTVQAEVLTPLQISIWYPVQLFPEDSSVYGLRLDLPHGNNKTVYGIDIGLFNQVSEKGGGIQIGIDNSFLSSKFSWAANQSFSGIQLGLCNGGRIFKGFQAGMSNYYNPTTQENGQGGDVTGVSIAGANVTWRTTGFQLAAGNSTDYLKGLQVGFMNAVQTKMTGAQLAIFLNMANESEGFQFAIINYATRMKGIQIGIINIIKDSSLFVWPIVNASF